MKPRASRSALIVASVPEDTSRTSSSEGTQAREQLGQLDLGVGGCAEGERRATAASCTASTTAGCAWPATIGPHEPT